MIDDKEVGQFFRTLLVGNSQSVYVNRERLKNLIHKLVEERAWRLCWFHNDSRNLQNPGPQLTLMSQYIPQALHDFGIPESEWK